MHFDYTLKLELPLDEAWATLMDIERIAPCMPGAKIESRDGDNYSGRLKVKLGPMEMVYRGDIHFIERDDEAKRAVVDAAAKEAKGRGEAKTQVSLVGRATDAGSEIDLSSEFTVSGKAAQFGRGVMEEVGAQLMDTFAERLGAQIGAAAPSAPTAANAAAEPPPAVTDEPPVSTVVSSEQPPPPAIQPNDEESLDIGQAAWLPLLKRVGVIALLVGLAAYLYQLI